MNGRKLSAALTALPEDLVAVAMEPGCNGRSFSWLRLAVCAVIVLGLFVGFWPTQPEIVTAPGLLSVKVYAMEDSGEGGYITVPMQNAITVRHDDYTPLGLSVWRGIPVQFDLISDNHDVDQITYKISVSSGEYYGEDWHEICGKDKYFSLSNQSKIFWDIAIDECDTLSVSDSKYDHVYTKIIIYEGVHIIGYSILRFDRLYGKEFKVLCPELADYYEDDDPVQAYYSSIVESVMFPKVKAVYQNIPFELVESFMEETVEYDMQQFK